MDSTYVVRYQYESCFLDGWTTFSGSFICRLSGPSKAKEYFDSFFSPWFLSHNEDVRSLEYLDVDLALDFTDFSPSDFEEVA